MKYINTILIVNFALIISCNTITERNRTVSVKDSLLKQYFLELDSLPYYDTTDVNYQVLKAFHSNDTNFLKALNIKLREERDYHNRWALGGSCLHLKKIQELGAEEAFRFDFLPPFCSTPINITITFKNDSASLEFLLYQNAFDTAKCNIISHFSKSLTKEQWEEFRSKLWNGDIWGLKRENGIHGMDGSNLTFIGYQSGKKYQRPDKIIYGERWVYSSLKEAFEYALIVSGNRKGCYSIHY